MNARELAFLAVDAFFRKGVFLEDFLRTYRNHLSPVDERLAQEVSYGTVRMAKSLDYLAERVNGGKKISLSQQERNLLRTALYQACFMDRIPLYALVDDTVSLARKKFHASKAGFFNALLRKLEHSIPSLPEGRSITDLSIAYSLPEIFIQDILDEYTDAEAISIFQACNHPPVLCYRDRTKEMSTSACIPFSGTDFSSELLASSNIYIQNITPVALVEFLAARTSTPKRILDLCCSPGGKLLAAHDAFPQADLYANDVSPNKIAKIQENTKKYHLNVDLTCGPGEAYFSNKKFDLIILDVPCSNTGVLNKRPEARWRYSKESKEDLVVLQKNLLAHALTLLNDSGVIWYMTCSILREENEQIATSIGTLSASKKILSCSPYDGGFAALIKN